MGMEIENDQDTNTKVSNGVSNIIPESNTKNERKTGPERKTRTEYSERYA